MRRLALLGMVLTGACSTTQYVLRDQCWIKQTEGLTEGLHEEIVVCPANAPEWSEDRVTRSLQECLAARDRTVTTETLRAERRGETPAARDLFAEDVDACRAQAAGLAQAENEKLDALLQAGSSELARLQGRSDTLTEALAEAAKKPSTATATANADGNARSGSDSDSGAAAPAATLPGPAPAVQRLVVPYKPVAAAPRPKPTTVAAPEPKACACPDASVTPVSCEAR